MSNELPTHIVKGKFSDLKYKINNKWPNVIIMFVSIRKVCGPVVLNYLCMLIDS